MPTSEAASGTTPLTPVTLGGAFGLRNVSPFWLEVEMLLTSLGLPFEFDEQPDPRKAPKGKLPYQRLHAYTDRVQQHVGVYGR